MDRRDRQGSVVSYKEFMLEAGRKYFDEVLRQHNFNRTHAAQAAKLNRTDFYKKLHKYGVEAPRKRGTHHGNWHLHGL